MGRVVNKSFSQVRKSIGKKALKLASFLENNNVILGFPDCQSQDWNTKQNAAYEKLSDLCSSLVEEVDNLDEIEVPDYKRTNKMTRIK